MVKGLGLYFHNVMLLQLHFRVWDFGCRSKGYNLGLGVFEYCTVLTDNKGMQLVIIQPSAIFVR